MAKSEQGIPDILSVGREIKMPPDKKQEILMNIKHEIHFPRPKKSRKPYYILSNTVATMAAIVVVVGIGHEVHLMNKATPASTANNTLKNAKKVDPASLNPERVNKQKGFTTYVYTDENAKTAIKDLATFKVKIPSLPTGFIPYRIMLSDTVPKQGNPTTETSQFITFGTIRVPGKTPQQIDSEKDFRDIYISSNHHYIQYHIDEFPTPYVEKDPYFTAIPFLKTVTFDGTPVQVYGSTTNNAYRFQVNGRQVAVYRDAGFYTLGADSLTDKIAWDIIDSMIKGQNYVN